MRNRWTVYLAALLLSATSALPAIAEDFSVMVDPLEYPPGAFQREGVKVGELPSAPSEIRGGIPNRGPREEVFARIEGLLEAISTFDELDRDMLYIRARHLTPAQMEKTYPQIPAKTLEALREAVQE